MGIFGKMDAAVIPSNPFFIKEGDYDAEVTSAQYKPNRDGQRQLVIQYTLSDGEFKGRKATSYFTLVDDDMDQAAFDLLPDDEKAKIRSSLSALKRTLCGNENNYTQKGLGVKVEELNDEENPWDPATLVGTKVHIGISNYGTDNSGVNVKWVNLQD